MHSPNPPQEFEWPEESWNDWTDVADDFAETEPCEWVAVDEECHCGGFGGCICERSPVHAVQELDVCKSKKPSPGSVGSTGAPSSSSRSSGSFAGSRTSVVMVEEQGANAPSEAASSVVSLAQSVG